MKQSKKTKNIMHYKVTTQKANDTKGMYKVSIFDTNLWEEIKISHTNDAHFIDEIDELNENNRINEIIDTLLNN